MRWQKSLSKQEGLSSEPVQSQQKDEQKATIDRMGGFMYPNTFVPLPLSNYPSGQKMEYAWIRLKNFAFEVMTFAMQKFQSMPSPFKRPEYKSSFLTISQTAKQMYIETLEAFAAGDKATINRLCHGMFASKLCAAIDKRNPKQRTTFEVVSYDKKLFYPRVASYVVTPSSFDQENEAIEQVVVALATTQKTAKLDAATGQRISNTLKMQTKVEQVVLTRNISTQTWAPQPWRIWGTTTPTTLKKYKEDLAFVNDASIRQAGLKKRA